jgi:acyl-CoA thioesterase-1
VGLLVAACGSGPDVPAAGQSAVAPAVAVFDRGPGLQEPDRSGLPRIVVLGDSLTAGLGLPVEEAYPAVLQQRVTAAGYQFEVVSAGVSGDTTAGGLRRLAWSLDGDVRVLIVALGGNDGLRGLPVEEVRRNLSAIVSEAEERNISVLLAGMEAPPNLGPDYTGQFREAFGDVAREFDTVFVPFLLEGVAGIEALNQRDGIHPTAEGARIIADTLWPALESILQSMPAS